MSPPLDRLSDLAKFPQMTGEDNPELPPLEHFLDLEHRVWAALMTVDAQADRDMLSPDFLGVYPDGFFGRAGHTAQLANGPTVAAYTLSEVRFLPVGPDHAMLCYAATYTRPGHAGQEQMYVSSLWARQGDGWRNTFSQDTPVSGD